MAEGTARQARRSMKPWVLLHLQKLGLELKCPLCLDFLTRPTMLPCNHIFCNPCMPKSTQFGAECFVCKARYCDKDLRFMPFMENIVAIYRSLDAGFGDSFSDPASSDSGGVLVQCRASMSEGVQNQLSNRSIKTTRENNSRMGHSVFPPNVGEEDEAVGANGHQYDEKLLISEAREKGIEGCRNSHIGADQAVQSSLDSPPISKGSDNDSNDHASYHSSKHCPVARSVKRKDTRRLERHGSSASETEGCLFMDAKRSKKLKYGPVDAGKESADNVGTVLPKMGGSNLSNSGLEPKSVESLAGMNDSCTDKNSCGFCQSSKISQGTGPMLHFANGKQVVGDEATYSIVIHVHKVCIDWAPQVYYDGDIVKNLKSELARGAKLKCSGCGLKGAALGCYVKSCRRSYHVPCALKIPKCRWDLDNYVVLCPAHSSAKLPNEKSSNSGTCNQTSHFVPAQITPQEASFWKDSHTGAKDWVLCGSALSSAEKLLLIRFASMIGVTVSKFWRPDVSHVIAATDKTGACTRTLKVLMAICNGRWVLSIDWVKACMERMYAMNEEPYEVSLDNYGCCNGPKTGRLNAVNGVPKLFNGLSFYFSGEFVPAYKEDIQKLVIAAGGSVCESEEELTVQKHDKQAASSKQLVVYNLDPPQGSKVGEEISYMWERLSEAENLASKMGSEVVGHTWILESIAAYKLQPVCQLT
ncbi:protein BREAST CANCER SUSCEPTIBILITY 1 [Tripterygium wilfordii]|uniref:RING-type E3 ubiquitin transferase BRCA1 n=1 Tax=Tripterygium wilfordii TaxID=458696 RepID=A0A7J7BYT8_TRIWF|nr:BRCA1-associated RING domain protein 1 [Tripterygium wilfordii]KAF5726998.1 protein BREAST CANCER SUSCEPTIBILITY 1 [Tripterygium wilfordii]